MNGVKFGINIPQFHPDSAVELAHLGKFVEQAESLDFDSLWTLDGIFHDVPFLDPLSSLAYAAAVTKRVKLGTAVLLLPLRVPSIIAWESATIDFLSSGRLILGVSLGGKENEYAASGVSMKERVSRLTEGIEIMRMLWTKQNVTYKSHFWHLDNASINLKPVQPGGIPILMGGSQIGEEVNEKAIKRAARLADGWLGAGSTTISASVHSFARFIEYAKEFKRDLKKLAVAKRVYIHVDPDKKKARDALDYGLNAFYSRKIDIDRVCIFGSESDCAKQLSGLVEAGARTLILNPVADHFHQAELLASDVIPAVS